jgi:hypothetical protein
VDGFKVWFVGGVLDGVAAPVERGVGVSSGGFGLGDFVGSFSSAEQLGGVGGVSGVSQPVGAAQRSGFVGGGFGGLDVKGVGAAAAGRLGKSVVSEVELGLVEGL